MGNDQEGDCPTFTREDSWKRGGEGPREKGVDRCLTVGTNED